MDNPDEEFDVNDFLEKFDVANPEVEVCFIFNSILDSRRS